MNPLELIFLPLAFFGIFKVLVAFLNPDERRNFFKAKGH